MMPWTFYPAFLATLISIVGWTYMAYRDHDKVNPRTLSELGAARRSTLTYFRAVLWVCGLLFAVTMYFFVVPRVAHALLQAIAWSITFLCEVLLGVFPAMGKTARLHDVLAGTMAIGMLIMAYLLSWSLQGSAMHVEIVVALVMSILGFGAVVNRRNFIFYELPFIFLAHITIVVAAIGLR